MISDSLSGLVYEKGDLIGDEYEVEGVLGAGGFGIVYLVYHHQTASLYALKTLRDPLLADARSRVQFHKEARIWVELERHPNIVRAYHVTEFQGRLFIALEYVAPDEDGLNSLDGFLAQSPPGLRQSLRWAIQFCDGMIHAHGKGIRCHRDIKPANIMIAQNKTLKISDVGLAGALATLPGWRGMISGAAGMNVGWHVTVQGAVGTPTHMPPEQFADAASCDARSDIYSFGVVLYQMCNRGQLPFLARVPRDNSQAEMLRFWAEMRRLHQGSPVPVFRSPLLPVVQRCLEKDAGRRYKTFNHLRHDLAEALKGEYDEVLVPPIERDLEAWELCTKGAALHSLGRDEQALTLYDEALRLDPAFSAAWNNKGISLRGFGRIEEALDCFDAALRSDPRNAPAWSNKGSCLVVLERYEEALSCHDRALNLDPNSPGSWLNKGNGLLALGRLEEAYKCFANVLQLNSRWAGAWHRQGLCCQSLGRLDEAIRCFDQATSQYPADAEAWCSKAHCLAGLDRNGEALEAVQRALNITPLMPLAWFTRAGIEERLGKINEALECYRQVLAQAGKAETQLAEYAEQRLLLLGVEP